MSPCESLVFEDSLIVAAAVVGDVEAAIVGDVNSTTTTTRRSSTTCCRLDGLSMSIVGCLLRR